MANRLQRRAAATSGVKTPLEPGIPLPDDTEVTLNPGPSIYAAGVQVGLIGNDFTVTFTRNATGQAVVDGERTTVAQVVPVVEVALSAATLKDAVLLLTKAVGEYEAEFGAIETAYSRKRASEDKA